MPRPDVPPIGLELARTARTVSRAFDAALAAAGGSTPVWLILMWGGYVFKRRRAALHGGAGVAGR